MATVELLIDAVIAKLAAVWANPALPATLATLAVFGAIVSAWERRNGRNPSRYLGRPVRTDLAYAAFYLSGVYGVLVWGGCAWLLEGAVARRAPFLRLDLLGGAPAVVHVGAFVVVADFLLYWKHRLMHARPRLWAFHSVHHSQRELTFLTSYRFHFVDELLNGVVRFGAGLALGVPAATWLPVTVALAAYQSVQHSDTGWSFGPLDRVLVSSRFHNVHHSAEPQQAHRNFGLFLSVWDRLFSTAAADERRPAGYGVPGEPPVESFWRQAASPFAAALGWRSTKPGSARS